MGEYLLGLMIASLTPSWVLSCISYQAPQVALVGQIVHNPDRLCGGLSGVIRSVRYFLHVPLLGLQLLFL